MNIDERLSAIEETLGVRDISDAKSSDFDITSLRNILTQKGLGRVLKIPHEQLEKLKDVTVAPDARPLSEKLSTIECCEDLIKKRAELLEEFESRLEVVLNCDHLSGLSSHEAAADVVEQGIVQALQEWKTFSAELEAFRADYFTVLSTLGTYILQLEEKISSAERKAAVGSSDA